MTETVIIIFAVVASVALIIATFHWGRFSHQESPNGPSSLNIAMRKDGWIVGFAKLRRLRQGLHDEAATRRTIIDAKKAERGGSVGSVDQLLKEADELPD